METTLIADDNTASPPVSDDARNLVNLPPEILQLVLRSLFQPFEIVCRCHPCLKSPHRHSHQDERYWHVLLTSHRLYTEGIPTYYSFCTLDMLHLMPLHLGTVVIKNVRNVRFHSLAILSPWRSRESERTDLCLFLGVKTIELPTLEYLDEKATLDEKTDEDILSIESNGNGYGRWCDYSKWAREVLELPTNPDLVVKFQKIFNSEAVDVLVECDITITKDKTEVKRSVRNKEVQIFEQRVAELMELENSFLVAANLLANIDGTE